LDRPDGGANLLLSVGVLVMVTGDVIWSFTVTRRKVLVHTAAKPPPSSLAAEKFKVWKSGAGNCPGNWPLNGCCYYHTISG